METTNVTQIPKILVVDDDHLNRKYYLQVLKRQNYDVDEAASGEEAVDRIAENTYDLILSDLQMYNVGGLDVLQVAKEKDKHLQVVIMTGYGSIPTAVKAMQHGAFDYLSKPVNKDAFLLRVQKALKEREMQLRLEEQQKRIESYNEMIKRDLDLAEKVQASLVPSNFENEHVALAIEYHPMIGIGGDFLSVQHDFEDNLNINIVDVTGHGIAAALLVNRLYNEMREILRKHPEPKDVLADLNDFFYNTFGNMGLFLTIMSVQFDFAKRCYYYAGGAHPAALHYNTKRQSLTRLYSQNTIIGFAASDTETFQQNMRKFESGDRLIIYTDGILEAEDKKKNQFGLNGLKQSLQTHIQKPVETTAAEIIRDVRKFTADSIRDDIMLMIVELK